MKRINFTPKLATNPKSDIEMILSFSSNILNYRDSVDELKSDSVVVVIDDHSTENAIMDKLNIGDFDNRNVTEINYTHIKSYPENLLHASMVFDNKKDIDVILLSHIK